MPMMRQRQDAQAAYANEQKPEQKGQGEQRTFIVNDVARHIRPCDPDRDHGGGDERRQGESDAGNQFGNGDCSVFGAECPIGRGLEAGRLNVLAHDQPANTGLGNVAEVTREPGNGSTPFGAAVAAIGYQVVRGRYQ
jgi:hypothetical protein